MLGQSRYSSYSAKTQQSKEELLVSDCSWEQSESRYTAPPPPPYTDAHSSRRTKLNVPGYLGLGDALAISPHHPGPFPSNFSVSPAESDSEQEVVNSTQDRWVFDAGSDSEQWKCHRSTSSTSCGSAGESTKCSSADETDTSYTLDSGADAGVWPSMGSVGHPHMCAAPCKFAGKHNCKDGASCTRCHICIWTRAKYRERAGAHRTLEMMSV